MNYVGDHALSNRMSQEQTRIRRVIAGGAPSSEPDNSDESIMDDAASPETANEGLPPGSGPDTASSWKRVAATGTVVGGLAGAVMAVATYLVLNNLIPQQDMRVPAIAQRVVANEQRLNAYEQTLRAAEVDVARLLDGQAALSERVDTQAARTEEAFASVDAARAEMRAATGGQSPVFGVAVAQLGLAIASGRPFEAEWVNVYSMTADEPELQAVLQPLMSRGLTGIETPGQLRAQLAALSLQRGLPNPATGGYVQAGLMAVQSNIGVWLGYSEADLMAYEKL
ncbi:MAG: hypothetical protein AB7O80_22555, partial [Acetobacteraceae bacterium]